MRVKVLYPDAGYYDSERIIGWAHDAMVNDAVDDHVRRHGPLPDDDDAFAAIARAVKLPDLEDAMDYLADTGRATFARVQPEM